MDEFHSNNRYLIEKVIEETIRNGPVHYRPARPVFAQPPPSPHEELPDSLTPRETEVLCLVARGLTNSQVAQNLTISPNTVHAHLHTIYSKLGIKSRTAAVRFAFETGLF